MNKKQAIDIIEGLYPPDTETGEKLLQKAKNDCNSWRDLPENILIRYADLCQQEENHQQAQYEMKQRTLRIGR